MASPPDLSLGCQTQAPSSASTITSSEVSNPLVNNQLGRIQALKDEQRKIEAFKRELPLCMQLLEEGIFSQYPFWFACPECPSFERFQL
jgi:hypothetical protein